MRLRGRMRTDSEEREKPLETPVESGVKMREVAEACFSGPTCGGVVLRDGMGWQYDRQRERQYSVLRRWRRETV